MIPIQKQGARAGMSLGRETKNSMSQKNPGTKVGKKAPFPSLICSCIFQGIFALLKGWTKLENQGFGLIPGTPFCHFVSGLPRKGGVFLVGREGWILPHWGNCSAGQKNSHLIHWDAVFKLKVPGRNTQNSQFLCLPHFPGILNPKWDYSTMVSLFFWNTGGSGWQSSHQLGWGWSLWVGNDLYGPTTSSMVQTFFNVLVFGWFSQSLRKILAL